MKFPTLLTPTALLTLLSIQPAFAWFPEGHSIIAKGALETLPADVPQWFRDGGGQIGHNAQDPDVHKERALPTMTEAEDPQHFIDLELLQGKPLPNSRKELYALCATLKVDPKEVGELPYALAEWTERLTVTFAEARAYPNNKFIQTKALVYAGILSHYSGDMCMPLHTTIHFNGRAKPDGTSPKTGIHLKVDSLIERCAFKPSDLAGGQTAASYPALMPGIIAQMSHTRGFIDQTYALEPQLPPEKGDWTPTPEVKAFALERGRASTQFTANLFLTAWRNSATIKLPFWLKREVE